MHGKLQELRLRNFQCHSELDVVLDDNVTTIVGPSDVGKSAVIRALKWLATNKPTGDSFRKYNTKNTTVGLKLDDGEIILRKKGDTTNKITHNKKVYKSFGTDVPEPVVDKLNLCELSFQAQHDPPYWLSETAGQVSRELNRIVNLDVIDTTLKNIASLLRKTKTEQGLVEARLQETQEEAKKLEFVDELHSDYQRLVKKETKAASKATEASRVASLVEKVVLCAKASDKLTEAYGDGSEVVEVGEEWREKVSDLNTLESLVTKVVRAKEAANVVLPSEEEMGEVVAAFEDFDKLVEKGKQLVGIIKSVEQKKELWLEADQAAIKAKRKFRSKTGGVCPICGNDMKLEV